MATANKANYEKKVTRMPDGRRLIYYSFLGAEGHPDRADRPAAGHPAQSGVKEKDHV